MTIAGLNPRSHVAEGFDASSIFSRAGIGLGGVSFSAFVAMRPKTMTLAEDRTLFGTLLAGVGGWEIKRQTTAGINSIDWVVSIHDGFASTDVHTPSSGTSSLDRIFLLGFTYDGANIIPFMNGCQSTDSFAQTFTPGTILSLGGDPVAAFGTKEGIIGAGFRDSPLTTDEWEAVWRTLRHTGDLAGPEMPAMDLVYETRFLVAQSGLQGIPADWINTGTLGAGGDLSRTDGASSLTFVDDNNPAYAGSL